MASGGGGAGGAGSSSTTNVVVVPGPRNRALFFESKYTISKTDLANAYSRERSGLFTGLLCDTVGFSQHGGECWSDTIQQIIFFADGLKEYTQPYFYNTPYAEVAKAIEALPYLSSIEKEQVKGYAKAAQQRFINHYNLAQMEQIETTSNMERLERRVLKRRNSIVCGVNAARAILGYERDKVGSSISVNSFLVVSLMKISGCTLSIFVEKYVANHPVIFTENITLDISTIAVFDIKNTIFGLSINCITLRREESEGSTKFSAIKKEKRKPGHAIGLYVCNGKMSFYDDNFGIFETLITYEAMKEVKLILLVKDKDTSRTIPFYFGTNTGDPLDLDFQTLRDKDDVNYYETSFLLNPDELKIYKKTSKTFDSDHSPFFDTILDQKYQVTAYIITDVYAITSESRINLTTAGGASGEAAADRRTRRSRRPARRASTRKRRHS